MNRYGQWGGSCDVGDEVSGGDNGGYFDEDQDNSDYQWNHSQCQVNFAASGGNDSRI